ncbi:MAG: hypothetical protein C9355_02650 [Thalassolituus maritimus]|nr:hypothetical protein [Thalassolituus maritimus]TPD55564.1 MAG: hypothetical protein C9355_02650 [Thalassolituus maritimus]
MSYVYLDLEVAADYVSASPVEYQFGEYVTEARSTLFDGLQEEEYGSRFRADTLSCVDSLDWRASAFCQDTALLEGAYQNGADLDVNSRVFGHDIVQEFSFEALPNLLTPIDSESYSRSADTVVVSWNEPDSHLQLSHLRLTPCSSITTDELTVDLSGAVGNSFELVLSEYSNLCGFDDELMLEVGYETSGQLSPEVAGGRFRVRMYSTPVTVQVTD